MLRKITKDVFLYGMTNGLKSLVPVLIVPILTRYLTPEEYGVLSIIEISILFLLPFISLNIHGAIQVEYFQLKKNEFKDYISEALVISFLAFCIVIFLFFLFSNFLEGIIGLPSIYVRLLPLFCILRLVSNILGVIFQAKGKVMNFAKFTLLQTLLDFSLSLLFVVFFKFGFVGRLTGTYSSFLIITLIGLLVLRRMGYLNYKIRFHYYKKILKFGVPLIPHALGGTVLAMSDRYFIMYFIDEQSVGFYSVSYQIAAVMLLIGTSVNLAWTPVLFEMLKRDTEKDHKMITQLLLGLIMFFILSCVLIYFLSDLLFYIFSVPAYYSAKEFFPYLLLGFLFQSIYMIFSVFLFYEKRTSLLSKITFSGAIINLILNYFFINLFSTVGVAYATAITWGIYSIVIISIVSKSFFNTKHSN